MKKIHTFNIELTDEEYRLLQRFVKSGGYRTKIAAIRDLIRRADMNEG